MFFRESLPFIREFIDELELCLREHHPEERLSRKQKAFLGFCLMGILVTNSVCWARFERASLGAYSLASLSWMFRKARIPWEFLLHMGVRVILRRYNIGKGVLLFDDTNHKRAKTTRKIGYAHKVYDKKTDGYFNGQVLVFLLLVTEKITLPVGFAFYCPDPALKAWKKLNQELKDKKVPKKQRPPKPLRDPNYPTKEQLAQKLMETFSFYHQEVLVRACLGDNHYSTSSLMDKTKELFGCQYISSMKANQKIRLHKKELSVSDYFTRICRPVRQELKLRGGETQEVFVASARLYVPSHGSKRFVLALKYAEESEMRYLLASQMSWRTLDILETWTLRWLIEVFFEDFKSYEGWGQLAKQYGDEGSSRGVSLSLLCDLALFLHPSQKASLENKLPIFTVGSLLRNTRAVALFEFVKSLVLEGHASRKIQDFGQSIQDFFLLKPSQKHMNSREMPHMEPAPCLLYREKQAFAAS